MARVKGVNLLNAGWKQKVPPRPIKFYVRIKCLMKDEITLRSYALWRELLHVSNILLLSWYSKFFGHYIYIFFFRFILFLFENFIIKSTEKLCNIKLFKFTYLQILHLENDSIYILLWGLDVCCKRRNSGILWRL